MCDEKEVAASNGKISFTVRATDPTAPVAVNFTNTGTKKATYKVSLTSPAGSAANPITLKDGTVTVKMEEGNNRGVYYEYKATGEGTFTLECKNTVNYTVSIKNLSGTETITLDKNKTKADIDVRKDDKVQIIVTAVAKDGKYPAAEAKLNASFKKVEIPTGTASGGNNTTSSSLNTNGKLVNADEPIEHGGAAALSFSAEVKAGEIVLYHLYKISGTTLRISDATAYVIYGDKTYTPDSSGNIYVSVTSDGPSVPVIVKIGNGGKTDKTYAVKCSYPEGSRENPYDATSGTIKTKLAAGNDQGVFDQCTAEKDGILTIKLKSVSNNAACDIRVTVTDSSYIPQQYLLSESEDGKTLVIEVYEDDEIEFIVSAIPVDNKYPAATVEFTLSFS